MIVAVDDPNDVPPDSHRNVKNVDFGNHGSQPLAGDFDRSGAVDTGDYILWRRTLGTNVGTIFDGADGDGDGVVDPDDLAVWRAHYGETLPPGSGSQVVLASAALVAPAPTSALVSLGAEVESAIADPQPTASSAGDSIFAPLVAEVAVQPVTVLAASYPTSGRGGDRSQGRFAVPHKAAASSPSDRALLAWLAESSLSADRGRQADSGLGDYATQDDDELESVDAVFETLENCALAGAGAV